MKKITTYTQQTKNFVSGHKILSVFLVAVLFGGGYLSFHKKATAEVRYVTSTATKGTVVVSVTGSGQVAASNEIDLKAKTSGQITYVGVKAGDVVSRGKTLFSLDTRDAQKAVRDAQTALETSQLELEKFTQAPDDLDVAAINADISNAEKSKTDADKSIRDTHQNLLNSSTAAVSTISGDTSTPPTITGTYMKDQEGVLTIQLRAVQGDSYFTASSTPASILGDAGVVGKVSTIVPQPIGDTGLYIKFASTNNIQSNWAITFPNKSAANYASNLKAYQDALDAKTQTVQNADLTIAQDKKKIQDLYKPDALDLRAKQIDVEQKQNTLADAKQALSDYYVSAPFDGVISSVTAKLGDTASGTLATIITKQNVASITLNEVDVSKIKVGEKATLTFDAIDGLSIAGQVASIDTVGTVTQGVVNYTVKITFDTQDERVKSGMTVSAAIVTDIAQDVLTVPASAVKTINGASYVQIFDTPLADSDTNAGATSPVTPHQQEVEVGLSDDSTTEIKSGLTEGDQIVSRTITATKTTTATNAPSLLGGSGAARTGAVRGGGATFQTFTR
jgi:HlyD family secretion protein